MRSILAIETQMLTWEPVGPRSYQLSAGDDLVATLDWATSMGSLATGTAADGVWTFKRAGFFRPVITVRAQDNDRNLAALRRARRNESILEFADGLRFVWSPTRLRRRQMGFFDSSGAPVISFQRRSKRFKQYADVEIAEGGRNLRQLSLLALLGWYRIKLEIDDEETAVLTAVLAAT